MIQQKFKVWVRFSRNAENNTRYWLHQTCRRLYISPWKWTSSSSSLAQQPLLSQGLPQKLLPAVPIPCSIPPISLPQLPGIFHHTIFPSQFRPAPLSPSFYHCNENSSCSALFLHTNNVSCPFNRLILMYVTISLSLYNVLTHCCILFSILCCHL